MSLKAKMFGALSDDIILKIFHTLEDDPRHWATLACVCTRFCSLIHTSCCKSLCHRTIPSDLLPSSSTSTAADWASLHKLSVCCPGPIHAGLLLETSDFGLQRELGPDLPITLATAPAAPPIPSNDVVSSDSYWSLYDDLYFDTVYNPSETETETESASHPVESQQPPLSSVVEKKECNKRRKVCRSSHLASGTRNLSREQGSKLLARQFRHDWLYICEWPGCVHVEEKRNYRLFRGVFKNFKRSRVWRTINDGKRKRIDLGCAFCNCHETWDLLSAFCLRRGFGYHDDGQPVVRAFVCENGHVSGAWTDVPIYT
ncbi:phytochrome A-associated F-box protein isoform X1 [Arachis stenosperma]|uniref:phytochrome A-associated F-box protein isoform X1 n=1 Tax=Arachis stenosperma TaxID=217475 RepID=UPI0025AC3204|nr:phytochrome A-associated F-box protein isoform X1 [Arachis stenosperma]